MIIAANTLIVGATPTPPKLKVVRLEEEARLLRYYQNKIQDVCRGFRFPAKVSATALLLFKRFYLGFSALDHDPKNIMLTAIYLACKARPMLSPVLHEEIADDVMRRVPHCTTTTSAGGCIGWQVEEAYISAEEFCRVVKQDHQTVLRNETLLLQGVHFDLIMHTPYWPLRGFFQDLKVGGPRMRTILCGMWMY